MTDTQTARLADVHARLSSWLTGEALPIWWGFGVDHVAGGFHEKLGRRCDIRPDPRRVRVLARQVFTFAVAGRLGWSGPWKRTVTEGLDYVLDRAMLPDGTVRKVIAADGTPLDDSFSLYDQAFALFAFAAAASVIDDRAKAEGAATRLRDTLLATYRHPTAGFEESVPPSLPLKANPHMHLFEACLAWEEVGGDATWTALADDIADLGLTRFIDGEGWLHEFFDADWRPMADETGRIVEPGHHFEWAWLLTRWGISRKRPDAIAAAQRLAALAEAQGMNRSLGVAINEMLDDGTLRDGSARLWPQTERIKGHVLLASVAETATDRDAHLKAAADAGEALLGYFRTETPGLWRDRLNADGRYVDEPAPASSFYHIICAIEEMGKAVPAA